MSCLTVEKFKNIYTFTLSEKIENVVFCGDIHGEFDTIVNKLCKQMNLQNTVLVIVGDCGFGFHKYGYYTDMAQHNDSILETNNNYILCIRGNHDSPSYFNEYYPFHSKRIFCMPDYSVIMYGTENILCVGGAASVDRIDRIEADSIASRRKKYIGEECYRPRSYWKNELPVYSKEHLDNINDICVIDMVAAHSCPSFIGITDKLSVMNWLERDSSLSDAMDFERGCMNKILGYLNSNSHPVRKWVYGHFHKSMNEKVNNVEYCMLNINEFKTFQNLI